MQISKGLLQSTVLSYENIVELFWWKPRTVIALIWNYRFIRQRLNTASGSTQRLFSGVRARDQSSTARRSRRLEANPPFWITCRYVTSCDEPGEADGDPNVPDVFCYYRLLLALLFSLSCHFGSSVDVARFSIFGFYWGSVFLLDVFWAICFHQSFHKLFYLWIL